MILADYILVRLHLKPPHPSCYTAIWVRPKREPLSFMWGAAEEEYIVWEQLLVHAFVSSGLIPGLDWAGHGQVQPLTRVEPYDTVIIGLD